MKNKYRILKILITVILLGFLLRFSLKRFSNQKITAEKVFVKLNDSKTPVYFLDEKDIKRIVSQENPTRRIGDINIPKLEKEINALPAVDSANAYLNLNGDLHLDIQQKVPVFRLNYKNKDFYVDQKDREFPISKAYSHPCMLVTGDIKREEYPQLIDLVHKIDNDSFSKKYFIGIAKEKGNYNLLTNDGYYKVEIGDLDNIDFKVKGFKTFVEKILVYQDPAKYNKISMKYDNQIVTSLNPHFKGNDSIIAVGKKELVNSFSSAPAPKKVEKKGIKKKETVSKKKTETPKHKEIKKPKERNKKTNEKKN